MRCIKKERVTTVSFGRELGESFFVGDTKILICIVDFDFAFFSDLSRVPKAPTSFSIQGGVVPLPTDCVSVLMLLHRILKHNPGQ